MQSLYVYPMPLVRFPSLLQFSGISISINLWGKGLVSKDYFIEIRGEASFLNYRTFPLLSCLIFKDFLLQNYFLFVYMCLCMGKHTYVGTYKREKRVQGPPEAGLTGD